MSLSDELHVERGTYQSDYPEDDFSTLEEYADVDTESPVGYEIGVYDGFSRTGVVRYYHFRESNVGYISWLEVKPEWRRQGIARELRRRAIEHLKERGVRSIWTGPVADILKPLVQAQGFEPAEFSDLTDYFVYRSD